MEIFILILYVVFGILSLILFFKVWGMCNNVYKIKSKFLGDSSNNQDELKYFVLMGKNEEAYNLLCREMYHTIFNEYGVHAVAVGYADSYCENVINMYKERFACIGMEIPDNFSTLDKLKDIAKKIYRTY